MRADAVFRPSEVSRRRISPKDKGVGNEAVLGTHTQRRNSSENRKPKQELKGHAHGKQAGSRETTKRALITKERQWQMAKVEILTPKSNQVKCILLPVGFNMWGYVF
jgi:hypothetical protein